MPTPDKSSSTKGDAAPKRGDQTSKARRASGQVTDRLKTVDEPKDPVDGASLDSFPASDPPAWIFQDSR